MAKLKQAPFTKNMTSNLEDPKDWADKHKMSDQEQYEHDIAKGMPLNAYSRKEREWDNNLREAAEEQGIGVAEDKETLKSYFDDELYRMLRGEPESNIKITPQAGGDFPNPSEERLITDKAQSNKAVTSNKTSSSAPSNKASVQSTSSNVSNNNNSSSGNSTGKVRSIQQAYYDGLIDKGTRDYMMADAIAKFARNTGRDIGNIGAQFTGGTVNNNYEKPDWDKRNEELFKQQTSAEAATIANSDKEREATAQKLANEKSIHGMAGPRLMQTYKNQASALAKKLSNEGNATGAAIMNGIAGEYALLESGATSSVDTEEHIGNIIAALGQAVASGAMTKEQAKEQFGSLADNPSFGEAFKRAASKQLFGM